MGTELPVTVPSRSCRAELLIVLAHLARFHRILQNDESAVEREWLLEKVVCTLAWLRAPLLQSCRDR